MMVLHKTFNFTFFWFCGMFFLLLFNLISLCPVTHNSVHILNQSHWYLATYFFFQLIKTHLICASQLWRKTDESMNVRNEENPLLSLFEEMEKNALSQLVYNGKKQPMITLLWIELKKNCLQFKEYKLWITIIRIDKNMFAKKTNLRMK